MIGWNGRHREYRILLELFLGFHHIFVIFRIIIYMDCERHIGIPKLKHQFYKFEKTVSTDLKGFFYGFGRPKKIELIWGYIFKGAWTKHSLHDQ